MIHQNSHHVAAYDARLTNEGGFAMAEAGRFFDQDSAVHRAIHRLGRRLADLNVDYAIAGGMAAVVHGYQRTTVDVDVLVTRADLTKIHDALDGLGYVPPFAGSKNLRDVEDGVRIEFLITGEFPGDGKPKPVAFPDPRKSDPRPRKSQADITIERDGIRFLALVPLIELKLASGMTHPGRLKDLADVQELIRIRQLDKSFAEKLNPYVRDKYAELLSGVRENPSEDH
ncbi:MAG: hypothetical protein IT445_17595 [Phycisphaeraceae bacterium]|nr:hypothetical protein [Phycisphaeraceae bacterium]